MGNVRYRDGNSVDDKDDDVSVGCGGDDDDDNNDDCVDGVSYLQGVPQRHPHHRQKLATLPSEGANP